MIVLKEIEEARIKKGFHLFLPRNIQDLQPQLIDRAVSIAPTVSKINRESLGSDKSIRILTGPLLYFEEKILSKMPQF